jgi:NTE family protein
VLGLLEHGYTFERVAGTSAGSIVAALLAAGADAQQLEAVMGRLDYAKVPDRAGPKIPLISEGFGVFGRNGAHPGRYIHDFVRDELANLGVHTFGDLKHADPGDDPATGAYKLVVTATDITYGRLLRLPWDYAKLGLDPDEQPVADAVRASISIPLFFEPVTLAERTLVDGGVLSNFPVNIFDRTDGGTPRWPTLGVKVMPDLPEGSARIFPELLIRQVPPVKLLEQVVLTAIVGHDQTYFDKPSVKKRTIRVDTSAVGIVEFDVDAETRQAVVAAGTAAAKAFLDAAK